MCERAIGRSSGFTLMEVMISFTVFLIISVGFTMGMLAALHTHTMAAEHYRATSLCRNRIQHARVLDFDSMPLLAETYRPVDEQGNVNLGPEGRFRRTTSISNISANVKEVTVEVSFPRPFGKLSTRPVIVKTKLFRGM